MDMGYRNTNWAKKCPIYMFGQNLHQSYVHYGIIKIIITVKESCKIMEEKRQQKQRTKAQNSKMMSGIKCKGSAIEKQLQAALWKRGMRYRKNVKSVVGKPDICFKGIKLAIFCDGEFWHGYDWQNRKYDFKSNKEFWIPKIERNMERDKEVNRTLEDQGWVVLRYWGKDIKKDTDKIANEIQRVYDERKKANGKI